MKIRNETLLTVLLFLVSANWQAKGFENLDFESADVSGYSPGSMNVPTTNALPGWSAYFISPSGGTQQTDQVWYNERSIGAAAISLLDSNYVTKPIQGQYSVFFPRKCRRIP